MTIQEKQMDESRVATFIPEGQPATLTGPRAEQTDTNGFSRVVNRAIEEAISPDQETGLLPGTESLVRESSGPRRRSYRLTAQGRKVAGVVYRQIEKEVGSAEAASTYISEAYRDLRDNHPEIPGRRLAAFRLISSSIRGKAQWEDRRALLQEQGINLTGASFTEINQTTRVLVNLRGDDSLQARTTRRLLGMFVGNRGEFTDPATSEQLLASSGQTIFSMILDEHSETEFPEALVQTRELVGRLLPAEAKDLSLQILARAEAEGEYFFELRQLQAKAAAMATGEAERKPEASFLERVRARISGAVERLKQENAKLAAKRQEKARREEQVRLFQAAFRPSRKFFDTDRWRGMSKGQKALTIVGIGAVASGVFCWLSPLIAMAAQGGNYVGGDNSGSLDGHFYDSLDSKSDQPPAIKPVATPTGSVTTAYDGLAPDPGLAYWGVPTERVSNPDDSHVAYMPPAIQAEYDRIAQGNHRSDRQHAVLYDQEDPDEKKELPGLKRPKLVEQSSPVVETKVDSNPEPIAFMRQALADPGRQVVLVIEGQFKQWNDKCPVSDKFCAPLVVDNDLDDIRDVDSKAGVVIPPLDETPPDRGIIYVHNFYGEGPGDGRVGIDLRNFVKNQPSVKLVIVDTKTQKAVAEIPLTLDQTIEIPRGSFEHTRMRTDRITIQNCRGVGKPMNGFLMIPGEVEILAP